ncbi:DUF3237 domain-containing protein [Leucobacter iarius]|uniref:Uncharacterized protein n=1 Tax=Leucobacter iarius TaxID=333963 RepID=A0ABN2LGR6_9MICO
MRSGPRLEAVPVAEIRVRLGEPLDFGETRDGRRRFTPVLGGELRGLPGEDAERLGIGRLRAEILPGGGDRQLLRSDDAVEIDAGYSARSSGGGLIGIRAIGIRAAAAEGEAPYFRVQLRFETAEPELAELQRGFFVADGRRDASEVRHVVHLIR